MNEGTLSSCNAAGPTFLNGLIPPPAYYEYGYGIVINEGYAIISSAGGVVTCPLYNNQTLGNCNSNSALIQSEYPAGGVGFYKGYVFLPNINKFTGVVSCQFNNGALTFCENASGTELFLNNYGIAIYKN